MVVVMDMWLPWVGCRKVCGVGCSGVVSVVGIGGGMPVLSVGGTLLVVVGGRQEL